MWKSMPVQKIVCFFEEIELSKRLVMYVKALDGKMVRRMDLQLSRKGKRSQQKCYVIFL